MSRFPEKSCTFEFDIDGSKTDREIASLIKIAIRPKQRKGKRVKKDIIFLCQFFYPEHNSSATLPFDTAKYLSFHGFSVDALCGYPKEYSSTKDAPLKEKVDGVEIQRIQYLQLGRASKIGRLINYFSFTASAFFHLSKLRKYKSVIVYSNPPILPFIAVVGNMLFGTKIVFVAYDVYPEVAYASNSLRPDSIIAKGMRGLNRMMYKRISRAVALTDEMKGFLLSHRPELSEGRVVTIANWAHEKRTSATDAAYAQFGYRPGQFVVSYFGNMGICQEMETLVGAIEKMSDNADVRFLFVGHGSKKQAIAERLEKKRLQNVQIHDFLTGESFEQAVAISSCCVVSLEKGIKGMCAPSKYYSYLQGGKPVLAIVEEDSYLAREVEQEEVGRSVRIGDIDGLISAVLEMYKGAEERKTMGDRAFALYESKYALDIGLSKYADMFNDVLGEKLR